MSQENVEVVRSIYAAWERGDVSTADWAHPDIEYVIADGPSPSTSKGLAAMAETHGSFIAAWQDWRAIGEEYRDLGEGRVLVLYRFGGRGKRSGVDLGEIWTEGASLFELVDGRVTRLVQYLDRANALASERRPGRGVRNVTASALVQPIGLSAGALPIAGQHRMGHRLVCGGERHLRQ